MLGSRYRTFAFPAALLATVALGACKKDQPPADTTIAIPAPAPTVEAVRVADVQIGKSIGSDKHVMNASDQFGVRDTVYLSVATEGTGSNSALKAKWTYNNGQVVNESTQTISPTGPAVTEFHITKPGAWPKGKYKVELWLDSTPAGSKEFEVK